MLDALPLVFVLVGVALYAVLGGADFGAAFWQLAAGQGPLGQRIRERARRSMAPVWEANHVWLIFALTVFWTGYPRALGSIASTLALALLVAGLGIVMRGAAYAMRAGATTPREQWRLEVALAVSSILTPFAFGAAAGAIATGRVPVGNATGDLVTSWLGPTSVVVGLLSVVTSVYLAAVWLAADAARTGDRQLERALRRRGLAAGVAAGALAAFGLLVLRGDDRALYDALLGGAGLPAVLLCAATGVATMVLLRLHRYEAARWTAAVAVGAIVAGWALAQWPQILPGLTVDGAAAPRDTMVAIVVTVMAGGVLVLPALALLLRLSVAGVLVEDTAADVPATSRAPGPPARGSVSGRVSVAGALAGVVLLTLADTGWGNAIGVVCLMCAVIAGVLAIVPQVLSDTPR